MGESRLTWLLRFDVFVTGAVVMALEIIASRLLAPVFGDSVFVWGSLIGVIMASLALGYYTGGRIADKGPSYRMFSLIIFSGGVLTLLIPIDSSIVLEFVYGLGLGERYGPIMASLLLLATPTALLGMLSPYAIKLAAVSLVRVGGVTGSLYSISTAGSIFGTFFTVFVLVPLFNVRTIIFSLGLTLVAISLIGLTKTQKILGVVLAAMLVMPSTVLLSGVIYIHTGNVVYQKDTPYNTLYVVDDNAKDTRTLWLNNMPHSAMYLNGSDEQVFLYTDYFHMGLVFNPNIKDVLFIGGGGFSGPKKFLKDYDVRIDVVELDPEVVKAAKDFFDVPEDPRLSTIVGDGRVFLSEAEAMYDVIVLDAYSKTHVPFHLITLEFFKIVDAHLKPGGVIVSNFISSLIGDTSDLLRAEYKTVTEVFPQVYLFQTKDNLKSMVQNIILVATKDEKRYNIADLTEMAFNAPKRGMTLARYSSNLYTDPVKTDDVPFLTDAYAPTENLLNPVTGAPYEGGEEIIPRSGLNPLLILGFWTATLISIYLMVNKTEGVLRFRR